MNYAESLHYLENIYWHGIKLGLENIRELLRRLGSPEKELKVIHVAGTNGKGSATAMLSAILQEAGWKVGAYTSPHLVRYNERYQINGKPISDEDFAAMISQVATACDQMVANGLYQPTVFEVLTAAAFLYFVQQQVDYVLLEVGMGGRFDATNVVEKPLLSLIMSIGMDHMEYLGNTLEEIAGEKAGIIKPGRPVVLYRQSETVHRVIQEVCHKQQAPLYYAPETEIRIHSASLAGTQLSILTHSAYWQDLFLALPGAYQAENCAAVLLACEALRDQELILTDAQIRAGLQKAHWPGRMEVVAHNPLLILDGAHNVDGIAMLAKSIKLCCPKQELTLVLGVLGDKEYEKMAALLLPLAKHLVLTEPDNRRKLSAEALGQVAAHLGYEAPWEKDPAEAVRLARRLAGPEGVVLCAGSLYLIGAIRGQLKAGNL